MMFFCSFTSVIVDQAFRALTGFRLVYFKADGSALRLLFFYSFLFNRSPIVVIIVPGENCADLISDVRDLAHIYVVYGLPNSIPPQLLSISLNLSGTSIDYLKLKCCLCLILLLTRL